MKTLVTAGVLVVLLVVGPSLVTADSVILEPEPEESEGEMFGAPMASPFHATPTPTPANPCDVPFPDVAAQTAFLTVANTECAKVPGFVVTMTCNGAVDKATKACGDECATHHKIGITPPKACPAKITLGASVVRRVQVGKDCKIVCVAIPVPCACLDP